MAKVEFDLGNISALINRFRQAASGDLKKEIALWMQEIGANFLQLVQDEIIKRKVIDTRLLLASFHQGAAEGIWELSDEGLTIEIGTNVEYAAYVNDGHWTNPKGVDFRFVPGSWEGDRFIYDSDAKTGMVLKQKWIKGSFYFDNAIRTAEKIFPGILEDKLQQWINSYFSGL